MEEPRKKILDKIADLVIAIMEAEKAEKADETETDTPNLYGSPYTYYDNFSGEVCIDLREEGTIRPITISIKCKESMLNVGEEKAAKLVNLIWKYREKQMTESLEADLNSLKMIMGIK